MTETEATVKKFLESGEIGLKTLAYLLDVLASKEDVSLSEIDKLWLTLDIVEHVELMISNVNYLTQEEPGGGRVTDLCSKKLSHRDLTRLARNTDRGEARIDGTNELNLDWVKAIRATLYALGYDHDWVYGEAYPTLVQLYRDEIEKPD